MQNGGRNYNTGDMSKRNTIKTNNGTGSTKKFQLHRLRLHNQCCGAGPFLTGACFFFLTGSDSSSYKKYRTVDLQPLNFCLQHPIYFSSKNSFILKHLFYNYRSL